MAGDRNAVARLISWAENTDRRFPKSLASFYPKVGRARRWGITGPPGSGKSTLVNEIVGLLRDQKRTVGVLAVDPSSPFTGGALLGDRIRMESRTGDPGVFIRSMASRSSHGGLSRATIDACDVMDAFGLDDVLIETVGVGQAEYDVVSAADTVVVVVCPGAGDSIQAMKSGLLEVADVLVVNKDDRPGANRLESDLSEAVHIRRRGADEWVPPVVSCSAGRSTGILEVVQAIEAHQTFMGESGLRERRQRKRLAQVRMVAGEWIDQGIWNEKTHWGGANCVTHVQQQLDAGQTPYDVARALREAVMAGELSRNTGRGQDS